VTDRNTN